MVQLLKMIVVCVVVLILQDVSSISLGSFDESLNSMDVLVQVG